MQTVKSSDKHVCSECCRRCGAEDKSVVITNQTASPDGSGESNTCKNMQTKEECQPGDTRF